MRIRNAQLKNKKMETQKIIEFVKMFNEFAKESTTSNFGSLSFEVDKNTFLKLALELNLRINAPCGQLDHYWLCLKADKITIFLNHKPEIQMVIADPIDVEQFNSQLS